LVDIGEGGDSGDDCGDVGVVVLGEEDVVVVTTAAAAAVVALAFTLAELFVCDASIGD